MDSQSASNSAAWQQQELGVLTGRLFQARWNAMARMQAPKADALQRTGSSVSRINWLFMGRAGTTGSWRSVPQCDTAKPGAFRRPATEHSQSSIRPG